VVNGFQELFTTEDTEEDDMKVDLNNKTAIVTGGTKGIGRGIAEALVREGVSLARALKEQRVFAPVLVHLVANGEASGRLAPMLERAAGELEREAERRLTWFAALLQPALIVMMGAIVLVLVLAVMLPIVSMNQLIR